MQLPRHARASELAGRHGVRRTVHGLTACQASQRGGLLAGVLPSDRTKALARLAGALCPPAKLRPFFTTSGPIAAQGLQAWANTVAPSLVSAALNRTRCDGGPGFNAPFCLWRFVKVFKPSQHNVA
jgi:hypothetical protein